MVITKSSKGEGKNRVGEALRSARRERRMLIDDVASEIRVPPQHLRALEEGDLSSFAADVYARGAYQKYTKYLGLEREDYYHTFLRNLTGEKERAPLRVLTPATWLQRFITPYGVIGIFVGMGVLLVATYIGWQVQSFVRLPQLTLLEPVSSVIEDDKILVKGVSEKDVFVTVNEQPVLLGEEHMFEYELPLKSGINVLLVEAVGASGRKRVIERNLLVPRD